MNFSNSCDTLGRMVGKTAKRDDSLKSNKFTSDNEYYNLKNKLIFENKIDLDFYEKIKFLKLEELITLKLLASAEGLRGKLFNFPLFKYSSDICKESIFKFALSVAKSRKEASLILGIKKADMIDYIKRYNLKEEFYYGSKTKKN
ncbi:hypothetical protein OAA64_02130 [bacterium]|nr:hypothetical protein [bacterium]